MKSDEIRINMDENMDKQYAIYKIYRKISRTEHEIKEDLDQQGEYLDEFFQEANPDMALLEAVRRFGKNILIEERIIADGKI